MLFFYFKKIWWEMLFSFRILFFPCGAHRNLLTVKRQKLALFRHVMCHDSLSRTILQGTLEVGGSCGQQRKCWMDNIKGWTSLSMLKLLTRATCRKLWKRISAESSLMSPKQPNQTRDTTELNLSEWQFAFISLKFSVAPCSSRVTPHRGCSYLQLLVMLCKRPPNEKSCVLGIC